ncbi:MAG: T9SS-dependent M6-like inactivated metalloprotease [Bacteroidota bacterium]
MKKTFLLILTVATLAVAGRIPHPLSVGVATRSAALNDTLKILAVMVQFQMDEDVRTSGNGQFDLGAATEPIIDAPPHDSAYFADHFIFAGNYFRKASNGKQQIDATVLGTVITLPKQMKDYAPVSGYLPLAQMIEETWKKADSLNPGFPFSAYDLFIVFHAGVGKDVDLRGALGYDPTPFDIPSLYFSEDGLKNVFGASYPGISVQGSSYFIKNSVVLPETEVRKIPSIGDDITLKLSINGLLVANIASHLGLPDLFDTKTGRTAIGRFGLMDGQSIFTYSGIAPPEPSAWEKMQMGWTTPIDLYGTSVVSVPAAGLYETGSDTVYRIPISAKEYYLVENRQRDAKQNGQTVTMKWNGQIVTKTFMQDEEYFFNGNIDSVYGVVLDVDELDWGIPGLINPNNNYRGGIVIWHVDETIIEKHRAANSINADPLKRGIDVEEADGSQDIGQSYDLLSPGSGSEDGSPLDYWFSGNIAPVYKNQFTEKTTPNSLSNAFARSHITLKDFSLSSPRMTFEAVVGSAEIQLERVIKGIHVKKNNDDAPFAADLNKDGKEEIIYTSGDSIYVLKDDLTPFLNNSTGLFYPQGGTFLPALLLATQNALAVAHDSTIFLISALDGNNDGIADLFRAVDVGDRITTPVTTMSVLPAGQFIVGTQSGAVVLADTVANVTKVFSSPIVSVHSGSIATADSISILGVKRALSSPFRSAAAVNSLVAVQTAASVTLYDSAAGTVVREIKLPADATASMTIADINGDNSPDIVLGAGKSLYAYNINGSVLENFPFTVPVGDTITGSVMTADGSIFFGTANGLLYAVSRTGDVVDGFPLQSGPMASAPFVDAHYLLTASVDSSVSIRTHSSIITAGNPAWNTYLGSLSHSARFTSTGSTALKSTDLLPKKFAYNWPNPVYNGVTNIRYFLGREATVKITIINMAGELVDEIKGTGHAGLDNEVQWDVSKIQSGIYYAHVTATGSAGEQSQIIKIAVVK